LDELVGEGGGDGVETFVNALEGNGSGDLGIVEVGLANGGTGLEDNRNEELDESGEG
jgi:hypothetical protein